MVTMGGSRVCLQLGAKLLSVRLTMGNRKCTCMALRHAQEAWHLVMYVSVQSTAALANRTLGYRINE